MTESRESTNNAETYGLKCLFYELLNYCPMTMTRKDVPFQFNNNSDVHEFDEIIKIYKKNNIR